MYLIGNWEVVYSRLHHMSVSVYHLSLPLVAVLMLLFV